MPDGRRTGLLMLPTFIIGLREGLEAALIVGIVAAFLGQQDRRDALRQVSIGTAAAVLICFAVGVASRSSRRNCPHEVRSGWRRSWGCSR